ncbi:hypothetical protein [Vibrio sp. D431a]|uniref:hypothetical protein n=1 Tax=Vibrio sp. D431a TaxID=2837388 RepID=UPI00255313E3|nr:hypothetical protein [Vibrio sp. D431a]MDK9790617.1 hypothetical protein [Vibrio sp. D431a]
MSNQIPVLHLSALLHTSYLGFLSGYETTNHALSLKVFQRIFTDTLLSLEPSFINRNAKVSLGRINHFLESKEPKNSGRQIVSLLAFARALENYHTLSCDDGWLLFTKFEAVYQSADFNMRNLLGFRRSFTKQGYCTDPLGVTISSNDPYVMYFGNLGELVDDAIELNKLNMDMGSWWCIPEIYESSIKASLVDTVFDTTEISVYRENETPDRKFYVNPTNIDLIVDIIAPYIESLRINQLQSDRHVITLSYLLRKHLSLTNPQLPSRRDLSLRVLCNYLKEDVRDSLSNSYGENESVAMIASFKDSYMLDFECCDSMDVEVKKEWDSVLRGIDEILNVMDYYITFDEQCTDTFNPKTIIEQKDFCHRLFVGDRLSALAHTLLSNQNYDEDTCQLEYNINPVVNSIPLFVEVNKFSTDRIGFLACDRSSRRISTNIFVDDDLFHDESMKMKLDDVRASSSLKIVGSYKLINAPYKCNLLDNLVSIDQGKTTFSKLTKVSENPCFCRVVVV